MNMRILSIQGSYLIINITNYIKFCNPENANIIFKKNNSKLLAFASLMLQVV